MGMEAINPLELLLFNTIIDGVAVLDNAVLKRIRGVIALNFLISVMKCHVFLSSSPPQTG